MRKGKKRNRRFISKKLELEGKRRGHLCVRALFLAERKETEEWRILSTKSAIICSRRFWPATPASENPISSPDSQNQSSVWTPSRPSASNSLTGISRSPVSSSRPKSGTPPAKKGTLPPFFFLLFLSFFLFSLLSIEKIEGKFCW